MRSVERTIAVLLALNSLEKCSISNLEKATGISRPALYRIVETLVQMGYVYRGPTDTEYELTYRVRLLSHRFKEELWVTQVASPVIEKLQSRVIWPVDICTFSDNAMLMRETTRSASPLSIDHLGGGVRFAMHNTAVGRAYLAFCSEAERSLILQNLSQLHTATGASESGGASIEKWIKRAQQKGYGERYREVYDSTGAIAIPVMIEGRVFCCLSLAFIASVLTPDKAAENYLEQMKMAAAEIVSGFHGQRENFISTQGCISTI
jgi:IclR family mhp operon transcriptional activator